VPPLPLGKFGHCLLFNADPDTANTLKQCTCAMAIELPIEKAFLTLLGIVVSYTKKRYIETDVARLKDSVESYMGSGRRGFVVVLMSCLFLLWSFITLPCEI
jgi:hypothetical protein